jgi:uncharacterized protein YlxW (UPF0749 family)
MALLKEVMDPPLDPGYASWAESRESAGLPRSTSSRSILLIITAIILGFLGAVTTQTLRTPDPVGASARLQLQERIAAAESLGDEHALQIDTLRAEVGQLQQDAVPQVDQAALDLASLRAGATAVTGEGVVITLNDPPVTPDSKDGDRVLARDVQTIVNGLWANGAEAISINDQRLTSTSTIRFAGQAIVVDLKALARPYEIRVIGPGEGLMGELRSGPTGVYLQELRSDFGISAEVDQQAVVTVPAGSRLSTRVAEVPDDDTHTTEDNS